jgi:hypothetical protein
VKPRIHHAHLDQPINPRLGQEVNVGLAKAAANSREKLVGDAIANPLQRAAQDVLAAASLVADDLVALDADERRDVAEAS